MAAGAHIDASMCPLKNQPTFLSLLNDSNSTKYVNFKMYLRRLSTQHTTSDTRTAQTDISLIKTPILCASFSCHDINFSLPLVDGSFRAQIYCVSPEVYLHFYQLNFCQRIICFVCDFGPHTEPVDRSSDHIACAASLQRLNGVQSLVRAYIPDARLAYRQTRACNFPFLRMYLVREPSARRATERRREQE